ncbi:hypothetical protein RSOLAG1IB_12553 [Rhizoctonia solani AG-1 IB]|uniref:Uncharacterized protein n=1 Tax=Thanatephorus cucumeris (strain AG1-IB / isolate 7/3/14) TaxID=1108050 RepID=A0A0B7G1L3_THACB|nr:hypothetical protein RSOLAG1IB_12553 [Rhizoctonia solani AG-1 IB]
MSSPTYHLACARSCVAVCYVLRPRPVGLGNPRSREAARVDRGRPTASKGSPPNDRSGRVAARSGQPASDWPPTGTPS